MSLEDKLDKGCRCMGVNMLKEESCNHPGLGKFAVPSVDQPLLREPVRPPDPVIPEEPVQPVDQSDNIAMAEYFTALEQWSVEAKAIEAKSKADFAIYESELNTYISSRTEIETAVAPAEGIVRNFYNGAGWSYVDKDDTAAYLGKIFIAWAVQGFIILILFAAILVLQKRKDVT